jgi:hypothetical protein
MLENYSTGRHADAVAQLQKANELQRLLREFRGAADSWITSAAPPESQYRRATAAVLFLEAGRVAIESPIAYGEWRKHVEHYCDVVRNRAFSQPFERRWLLASVALLHGARDAVLLAGEQTDPQAYSSTHGHASHALRRFPDEPRFALAPVIVRREVNLVANRPGTPPRFLVPQLARLPDFGLVDVSEKKLAATIGDLTRLAADPVVGPEARLRLGILLFHLDRLPESDVNLQAASQSTDPFVMYLARLTTGLVLDASGHETEAGEALRAAVDAWPNAQSGVMALAARLFRSGAREEAAALMDRLAATSDASDPWREYSFGDLRFWPRYQAELRGMLAAMRGN